MTEAQPTTKNVRIDIMRAIGIILMVLGHSHCPGTYYIYLFHMALFFIISGYCYKTSHTDTAKGLGIYILKKIKRFYIPFIVFNALLVIIDHFLFDRGLRLKDFIILFLNSLGMNQGSTLSGAFWFLKVMLLLLITYGIIDYLIKKIPHFRTKTLLVHSIIAVIFLGMGYLCQLKGRVLFGFDKVLSYYILFHLGRLFKEKIHIELNHIKRILVIVISAAILIICRRFGEIDLDINQYVNPGFLLITSTAGWFLVYEISYYLARPKWLQKFMTIIGTNTMAIMVFHFLCFKLITYIQIQIYDLQASAISAFPVLYNLPFWWIAYTFVGLFIPLGLSLLYKRLIPRRR